jgi:peptide/nickel transport system substrate-binding protein
MKILKRAALLVGAALLAGSASAQQGTPVPEIHFLSWPAATYSHFAETSNHIVEEWEKLGLRVRLDQVAFPNPMLQMWFTDHKFDVVLSSLTGAPHRMEPDFFTNTQFNSANTAPGASNVGEYSNAEFDRIGNQQIKIYDPEQRRPLIYELQRMIVEEQPEAVLSSVVQVFAINKNNVEFDPYVEHPQGIRANANQTRMRSKRGQNLVRIGWTLEYSVLNPTAARTIEETEVAALLYDRLFWIGADGKPVPRLATGFQTVDDTTIDVTIRTGHTFSDGKPVTAEDVKFSFDYMKEWKSPYFAQHLARVASVEVLAPDKIRFRLTEAYAPFIMNTLGQMYVLPKHVWEPLVSTQGIANPQQFANREPVGSGPYTVRYRREGSELYLARRENHFAPPLSDLLYVVYGSAEIVSQSLKTGAIDVSFQPLPPAGIDEFANDPKLALYEAKSNGIMSLRYKTTGPVFWNRDLRRALFYAIPYERIVNEIYGGRAALTATPITPVNAYWHNPNLPKPAFNPEKARAMLKEAGFTWAADGRLHFPPK